MGIVRLYHVDRMKVIRCYATQFVMGLAAGTVLLISSFSASAALGPPALQCASVSSNGDVTLSWDIPPDPLTEFASYQIWTSAAAAGPYVLLMNVPVYAQTTQLHLGANADTGPRFYYMTTTTGGPSPEVSASSDTVATLFLQVFQSAPLGSADLSWNSLSPAPSANDSFIVWLEYPQGIWTELDTVSNTTFSYQHVVSVCEDSLHFRIELDDATGCSSFSNRNGDLFTDVTPPSSPVITVVTVDTITGLASIQWDPSPEGDTDGYIIVFQAPGGAVVIDTVYGQGTTTYEWPDSDADTRIEGFTVAAFDTCLTGTPPSPNTSATRPIHSSILLNNSYDACALRVSLGWNRYIGWPAVGYRIFVQLDQGPWQLLATVDSSTFTYDHTVTPFHTYCYSIEAIRGASAIVSSSNRTCVITDYPGLPAFNYIRSVSVTGSTEITIIDSVDAFASVQGYRLERSANGAPFEAVQTVGVPFGSLVQFVDTDVEPSTTGYQYRVAVIDACGNGSVVSNIGASILLQAVADLSGFNNLRWNGYVQWAGNVQAYGIFRQMDGSDLELVHISPPDPWAYADNVNLFTAGTGRFCYQVRALEIGNPSGINASSESNIACAVQEDLVYIPSAIVRGGANPIFKPVISYADVADYELSIINRWGQVFWTSTEPTVGWDGTYGGSPVPMGIYAYYCRYENGAGRLFEKRGTVTVLSATD